MIARRDPEATRAAILDAAEEVFLDRGVADATTSEIARMANVTKSLIHHHFGSKEALWTEVKLRRFTEYGVTQRRMLEEAGDGASVELLRDSMSMYYRFLQRNPQMVRLLAWMYLEDDAECADLDTELTRLGVERIRQSQGDGVFRDDVDPKYILLAFLALTQHWFQFRDAFLRDAGCEAPREQLDEEFLEALQKIFFQGILPRKDE